MPKISCYIELNFEQLQIIYFKTNFSGGLANRGDSKCVEDVKSDWKFADGSGWSKDPLLEASCEKDQSGKK